VSLFSVLRKPAISVSSVQARTYAPLMKLDLPRSIWHELLAWRPDVVHMYSLYVPANALLAGSFGAEECRTLSRLMAPRTNN
jgi:hypothetical protein